MNFSPEDADKITKEQVMIEAMLFAAADLQTNPDRCYAGLVMLRIAEKGYNYYHIHPGIMAEVLFDILHSPEYFSRWTEQGELSEVREEVADKVINQMQIPKFKEANNG